MKKLALILTAVVFIIGLTACGGGGDTPEKLFGEMLDVMDEFVTSMDSAGSADDVVAAIDKYSAAMKTLKPRMEAIEKDHPELKNMKGDQFPENLKQYEERFKEIMGKFQGVFGKVMQYASDPKVQEAQKKLQEAMQ